MSTIPDIAAALQGPLTADKLLAIRSTDLRMHYMLTIARETGWPTCFQNDLYCHDRRVLGEYPGADMVWILRDSGTDLYPACDDRHSVASYRSQCMYWSGGHKLNWNNGIPIARYFHVRPEGIAEVSASEAMALFHARQAV